jgi:LCP family protein required for cell wall assembly
MRYTQNNEFDNEYSVDIYSSYTDISSHSKNVKKPKRKKKGRKIVAIICVLLVALSAVGVAAYSYAYSILNKIEREPLEIEAPEELNIVTSDYANVKNIALFGIDTRKDNTSGRSDAIIVLTIDKTNNKIKLTSIARDSYVQIDGHGQDKITHAYAFGKNTLAVKTLNKNYHLEITDYVTVNFYGFSRIIDYIGGVEIDLTQKEVNHLNGQKIENYDNPSIVYDKIQGAGKHNLSGAQALAYARIRKIDGDIQRGNRQKNVLNAMFKKVKKMSVSKLPKIAEMVFSECQTSLSTSDIMSIGLWALSADPELENKSVPNDTVKGKGQMIRGTWYYVYDIEAAAEDIKQFILETEEEN